MNRTAAILAAFVLMVVPLMVCESVSADGNTITVRPYSIDEGKLFFEGTTNSVTNGTATITLRGVSNANVSFTTSCAIASGGYEGNINVGVLERGSYKITATSGNNVIGERIFSIDGQISISTVDFDSEKMEVSFTGVTNLSAANARIIGSYSSDFVALTITDHSFSGKIEMDGFGFGPLILSVTESRYHDEEAIDVGSFVKIVDFNYDYKNGKVSWGGYSTESNLSVELFDGNNSKVFGAFSRVLNGSFLGEQSVSLPAGAYKLRITSLSDVDVYKEETKIISNITVSTSSDNYLALYADEYAEVMITVENGTYSDINIQSADRNIAVVGDVSADGKLRITGVSPGQTTVRVYSGQSEVIFNVIVNTPPQTENEYTFTLRMDYDADKAIYGESRYSPSDLRAGITFTSVGMNAGEALENALKSANVPCQFWSSDDGTIRYWVDGIFGLGDVKIEGGLWKYWIQYQIVDGKEIYNQWSLGYYSSGGSFFLLYSITEESGQVVYPGEDEPEIPDDFYDSGTQTTVEIKENEDGSTTIIADSTSVIDGTQTTTTVTTKENEDGSTTATTTIDVTNSDGSSSTTESVSQVKEENGSTITDTVSSTQHKDADGNFTGTTEVTTKTTETDDSTVIESTVTSRDADGNVSSVSTVTETSTVAVAQDGTRTTESTVTETVKDSNGNTTKTVETSSTVTESTTTDGARQTVTETASTVTDASGSSVSVSTTETSTKLADGSVMVVRKTDTTENGNTITDIAAGSISGDGNVHTIAEGSAGASADVVTKVKTSADESSIDLSKDVVDTAIQQQTAVAGAMEGVETTGIIEVASKQRDVSVSVVKESFGDMAEADVDLRISSTQGSMTMGKDVLSNLSQKDDVTLSLAAADRSSMTSAQRETIESGSTTVSLKAMSGGESIGNELGGKVTVSVKHIAAEGKKAVAYYVDDNGKMMKVADQTYDTEKGEMTMVLDHFSIYTIVDEDPVEEKELPVTVLVCLGMIVILSLAIMLPQVFGRKN